MELLPAPTSRLQGTRRLEPTSFTTEGMSTYENNTIIAKGEERYRQLQQFHEIIEALVRVKWHQATNQKETFVMHTHQPLSMKSAVEYLLKTKE